jgi:hypothetical protein
MRFRDPQRHVKDLPAFNLNDIRKFDSDYLYWNRGIDSLDDFIGLHWNSQEVPGLEGSLLSKSISRCLTIRPSTVE